MKKHIILALIVITILPTTYGQDSPNKPSPITWQDVPGWRSISGNSFQLSPDGKYVAYALLPVEGDGEMIIQDVNDPDSKKSFPIGSTSSPSLLFSEDGRWIAFKVYPKDTSKKAAIKDKEKQKGLKENLILLDLQNNFKKTEFENINSYTFNNKIATHLAINFKKDENKEGSKGSDLLLVQLQTMKSQNVGHVHDMAFNKEGNYLVYSIDAPNQMGNGVHLMELKSNQTQIIESDKASYISITWTEKGDAFALLKMVKDKSYEQDHGKIIGVKNLNNPQITIYDPLQDSVRFGTQYTISNNRKPMWSEDLTKLFYGIHPLVAKKKNKQKEDNKSDDQETDATRLQKIKADTTIKSLEDLQLALAKIDSVKKQTDDKKEEFTKPDMAIWHWNDSKLQSRQQVLEDQDKKYSFWAMYDLKSALHIALQDSSLRDLNILPKEKYALGIDLQEYELDINLDGRNQRDLYAVDLRSGKRTLIAKKLYLPSYASYPSPSIDGTKLLYAKDGHFFIYDLITKSESNISIDINTTFVNTEDDHNVVKPMVSPLGWSSDSKYVLLRDEWDIWQVPVNGKAKAINLTKNGRNEKIRYQSRFELDSEEKGINLSKALYVRMYGEKNKKSGIAQISPGRNGLLAGVTSLIWEDANINRLTKAKNSEVYYYTKEKFNEPTNYFISNGAINKAMQVTQNAPDAGKYQWSSGVQLIDYISDKGDSLQAALFLPAGYEKGKKYPTVVYYYEKLSQTLHNFSNPGFSGTGWSPSLYTSNGYAVLIPDIVYTMDDPGMSAVWCVLPAVREALQTGVIDEENMGLHGHSWGGYQTSFLITQTNMFKAAAAGAPLTNMISMYNLIYWNTGGGNMSIFEASQGRFTGGPWENWESYQRNSPIYHVKNVQTPLLMLHNDKDGAVDFTQGIEYYNALRRLKKPVIMVQYKGENHGLSKLENRKDYSVRMMEFFDYYLKGKEAADWISDGVDRLNLDSHLNTRVF